MVSQRIHQALLRFAGFLIRHSIVVFSGLLISALCALLLARDLKFDFSTEAIYRGNDSLLAYTEKFKQTFGSDEAVLLVILQATADDDVLSPAALQWQTDVAEDIQSLPGVIRVDSVPTIQTPHFSLRGWSVRPLVEEATIDDDVSARVRGTLSDSELVHGNLISFDERVDVLAIFIDPALADIDSVRDIVSRVRGMLSKHPIPTGYQLLLSGLPELSVEVVDNLFRDLTTLIPLGGVVYLFVLGWMFRRVSGSLLPLCAVGIGLTWTLATFSLTHASLNLVSNILPVLLMIIGVSSCVQIITCYAEESEKRTDQRQAAQQAIARMAPACFLAALTTAVGFASLFTARSELLSRFGWQAAVGVAFQYISTVLTLGAMFRFFPAPTTARLNETKPSLITKCVTLLGHAVARNAWLAMGCAVVVLIVSVWSGSRVHINTYAIRETFDDTHPSIKTMELIERELSGIMPLEISLTAKEPGVFADPQTFHRVIELEQAVRQLPGVLSVQSYADLFREILSHWPGRRNESDVELVPASEIGQARLQRTTEFTQRFSDAFQYNSYVSEDGTRVRIRLRLREIGSRKTLALIASLREILARIFPENGSITAEMAGEGYLNAIALTILIRDLFYSLLTASLIIFTLIAIEFRSVRVGIIAALPNVTPLAVTLGYMGFRGYDMNVANVISFTICLGLADDNTIYFLYRFRQELEASGNTIEAIRRAFMGTGRAIVLTSILLLAGMAVLLRSDFVPTQRFAELTSVTIVGNLLGVLMLLPSCLILFWKSPPESKRDRSKRPAPCDVSPGHVATSPIVTTTECGV